MTKLIRKEALFLAEETTYNTEATPVAADALLVEDLSWAFEGLRRTERPSIKATLPPLKSVMGGTLMAVSFTAEIKGSGVAGTAPEIDPVLQAAGFARTDVASTSNEYKPASDGHKSYTVVFQEDGDYFTLTGCRANALSFQKETGGIAKVTATLVGHYKGQTAGTLAAPTFDDVVPSALIGVPFDLATKQPVISSFSIDLGLTTATPPDLSAADGFGEVRITGRNITGSFDPEAVSSTDIDFITDFMNNADKAVTVGPIGSAAGNKITFSLPKVNNSELSPGDRDGLRTYDYSFEARESTSDDELSILFE